MKRDMELIREILLTLEKKENAQSWGIVEIPGYTLDQVSYHVKLLANNNLIEGKDSNLQPIFRWYARSLTWEGHEFLDSIRHEEVFSKLKEKFGSSLSTVPISVLTQVAIEVTKEWTLNKFGFK